MEKNSSILTPTKYTMEEVNDRLTKRELDELNMMVDEFESFASDEEDEKYQRWFDLNRLASGS